MDDTQFPRTGIVVQPPWSTPQFASEASGVARSGLSLANPTDAVAEAAKRVHYGEAQSIERDIEGLVASATQIIADSEDYLTSLRSRLDKHKPELLEAITALQQDARDFSAKLRFEGEEILKGIQAKTAHVLACSASIRSHLTPHQES